jgi:hypothetical protein
MSSLLRRRGSSRLLRCLRCVLFHMMTAAVASAIATSFSAAQAQSVADIFTRLELIGTWAVDCARPPSREYPHFVVRQPLGSGLVHRQTIIGQGSTSSTIDVAHELAPHELLVSIVDGGDPARRIKAIWLVEHNRVRVLLLVTSDGRATISGGKVVANNNETPWINKCSNGK